MGSRVLLVEDNTINQQVAARMLESMGHRVDIAANGIDMDFVGLIGNAVGAMKVSTVGHRQSVEKIPLMKYITALLR